MMIIGMSGDTRSVRIHLDDGTTEEFTSQGITLAMVQRLEQLKGSEFDRQRILDVLETK